MTYQYTGTCGCGDITFNATLSKSLESFRPIRCDCDFCMARDLTYLADAAGTLLIEACMPLKTQTQGSNQASFLSCSNCGSLVAVVCRCPSGLKGTVNANLLNEAQTLKAAVVLSPKQLTPNEKLEAWDKVWFNVTLNESE